MVHNITLKKNFGTRAAVAYISRADNLTFDSIISE